MAQKKKTGKPAGKPPVKTAVKQIVKQIAKPIAKKVQKPAPVAKVAKPAEKAVKKPMAEKPEVKEKAALAKSEVASPIPTAVMNPAVPPAPQTVEEVILTDADGRRYCRVKDCDQASVVETYCRYHYLLYWKKIQVRKKILDEGRLERYIEELTARYPDKFLDMLRKDLRSEKEFLAAIQELEIDEAAMEAEMDDDNAPEIEEVRGISDVVSGRDEEEF